LNFDCQACGACCAYSESWPVFIGEGDSAGIPQDLIDFERGRMLSHRKRCAALVGDLGTRAQCSVYANRPLVCREFQAGSEDCIMVRRSFGMGAVGG